MKTIYKRVWSILLVITMLFSITSMTASAQESEVPDSESLAAGLEFLAAAFSDLGEDEDQASTGLIAVETPEYSVPAETTQEEAETEATPEAEQEAEVTVDSSAPSTKDVISEPWDIIRGDIVYADSPFAVGVNGKPVNATNCTYLVQNGVSKIAYCIEPGVAITESAVNSGYTANEEIAAWELLNWDQKEAVALAIAYGYRTVSFDHLNATVAEKYAAMCGEKDDNCCGEMCAACSEDCDNCPFDSICDMYEEDPDNTENGEDDEDDASPSEEIMAYLALISDQLESLTSLLEKVCKVSPEK